MRELSERIAALSPEKLGLLARRLGKAKAYPTETSIISRGKNEQPRPLSYAQERLWFLEQFQPGSSAYNIPAAIRVPGSLNTRALASSFNEIVRRHDVLRIRLETRDGRPMQVISPQLKLELPVVDLERHSPDEQEAKVQQFATEEATRVFDLSRGPLIRIKLLRLRPQMHVLLLTVHHIVADGWSLGILFRELSVLYQGACQGKPSPLPPLSVQYPDFAEWQRQWLTGERLAAEVRYWRERLAEAPAILALPTDRPRPEVQSYAGASHLFQCSRGVTERLVQLSRRSGSTLFMVLLAAFKVLLFRYTGQMDIVIGTPIANRNRTELEDLIGFFVNTLALRTDLSGDPTFLEVLSRVKEVTLGAYEHQDLPFEKLVEELQPERKLEHHPIFQVLFALQNAPTLSETLGAGQAESLADAHEVSTTTAKFDLSIFFRENAEGLMVGIEYNTDLFDLLTIERMQRHFELLLSEIAANPEQRLSCFSLLTETERRQISDWNRTSVAIPHHDGVHKLFEAQVEQKPDAVAVNLGSSELTYRDLNRRANQLAHFLRRQGVGPDVCVGCCMEPSHEMSIGVLGILKAGGVYVPLDPGFPRQRIAFIVQDAKMPVILTQEHLFEVVSPSRGRQVVLDVNSEEIGREPDVNPSDHVHADSMSYVIYTSGSTGEPKGVAMPHRALLNLILWQNQRATVSAGAKTLQFASPSFDVSIQEMFATWCSGGTLVLITDDIRRHPEELLHLLTTTAVERLFMAPVALQQLADVASGFDRLPALKEVIVAGEQLKITAPILDLFARLHDATLYNQYGPSESHVVSEFVLPPRLGTQKWLPPIGGPIANTHLYVMDLTMPTMLPVGVPGELCIGGVSLARGYLNRPDLTAEKFSPDPFSESPGARLYRTGDLARYRPDGNIEFLGRIDQQVKVRGFRIELGEVEAALGRHDSVKEAVVAAREDPAGDKRLVAYVVPRTADPPTVTELRRFLLDRLPGYMVPSVFAFLGSLPLTATGKVDRRKLPAPERARPELEEGFVAPRNTIEEKLAVIWADVLGLERVGVHDSFFELGGHSLLATQVISRVRDAFQLELPLKQLFETPSVAGFGRSIDGRLGNDSRIAATMDDLSKQKVTEGLTEPLPDLGQDRQLQSVQETTPAGEFKQRLQESRSDADASSRAQASHAPRGVRSHLPVGATGNSQAVDRWQLWEQHLFACHAQHMLWLESQRRVTELRLHLVQTAHELEAALQQQISTELWLFSFARGPQTPDFMPVPGIDGRQTLHSREVPGHDRPSEPAVSVRLDRQDGPERPSRENVVEHRRFPASFAQQRLWFLAQLQPGSFAYNIPSFLRLSGPLDLRALKWSFNEIVRRHEVLRTTLIGQEGEPVQVVAPELALDLPIEDLERYRPEEQQAEVNRLSTEEARYIFDLSHGPLIRCKVLRLGAQDHILLVTLHHIVADGWSLGVLFRELSVLYEAGCQGRPSPLPPLPIQYSGFAQWQRRWLTQERVAAQLQYWRERLAGAPSTLALPTDRLRPAVPSYAGAVLGLQVSRQLTQKLVQISWESGATLFMVLLASFKILLCRYTGQKDLVVGTPIANRNRTELEGLIGFFVNQLALRTDLSGDPTFLEVLRRVKDVALGAYEHQDLPFDKLVEELQPTRDLAQAPLFQVVFGLQNNPPQEQPTPLAEAAQQAGAAAMPQIDWVTAKIDMNWQCAQTPDGLRGAIEYATDLFDATTIDRMARQFESLLEQIADNPEQRVSEFRLMGASETGGRSLRDFPGLEMTQENFENLILEIHEA
jgi:amino acid adenylation domain-containing protein